MGWLKRLWAKEPLILATAASAAVTFGFLTAEQANLLQSLAPEVIALVTAILVRAHVTPAPNAEARVQRVIKNLETVVNLHTEYVAKHEAQELPFPTVSQQISDAKTPPGVPGPTPGSSSG